MSKTKNKNRSELEYIRGQLKAVRSENRQLRKQVNSLKKQSHFYEETFDEIADDIDLDSCDQCGKGFVSILDLKHIKILSCNICPYNERIRDNGKKAE